MVNNHRVVRLLFPARRVVMQVRSAIFVVAFSITAFVFVEPCVSIAQSERESIDQEKVAFFESKIRPALIEHCMECHSIETEASGGLLIDSKSGWSVGGDSGPAIKPGDAEKSRLFVAMTYSNPDLQMPPDGALKPEIVDAFRKWIADGAIDPRQATSPVSKPQIGMPVEKAKDHWAYNACQYPVLPNDYDSTTRSPIDYFVERQLDNVGLPSNGVAEPSALAPGQYRVRLAYSASENRASNTMVRVSSADGETLVRVDQRINPPEEAIWISLGEFRFEKDGQAFVLVTNDESDGHVVVDAIQFLPIGNESTLLASKSADKTDNADNANDQDAKQKENDRPIAEELESLKSERKQVEQSLASRPRFMTIVEQKSPANCAIHIRGDVHNLGEVVPRGFLSAINVGTQIDIAEKSSGRLELAQWLSHPSNPLTARVYANRVWCWLMGQGIVSSVDNFGTTGTQPTHPELLDWLASELIRSGWSTKHLVRTIVMSDAYRRRIINPTDDQQRVDPSNRYYWRGHSRRLTAESLRDSMLKISGELDLAMGGSLIPVTTKADYGFKHVSARRSIYQPVFRNSLPDLFDAFDFADASISVGERPRSTVSSQALVLLNHPWVSDRARAAAERYQKLYTSSDHRALIHTVFNDCLNREPTAIEISQSLRYLGDSRDLNRLQLFIRSIFASLDFRYLD